MAAFLQSQLDFIFFFYGLAFILLGAVCFGIRYTEREGAVWKVLGSFGFLHGGLEWLDLIALIFGDSPAFAWFRTGLMISSYVLLIEFARQVAILSSFTVPGRWIYGVLLVPVAIGAIAGGNDEANALGRYFFGFPGAMATAWVFAYHATLLSGRERKLAIGASVGIALYGIVAGLIVPAAPIWPASVFNYAWFTETTGLPIQLVRGLIACWTAFAIWGIWGHKLMQEMASTRYTAHLQRLFAMTLTAMALILVCGWVLTQYLGDIYKKSIEAESDGHVSLVASHLEDEMGILDSVATSLAGTPTVRALLEGDDNLPPGLGQYVLDLNVTAARGEFGLILNSAGDTIISSNGKGPVGRGEIAKFTIAPQRLQALTGKPFRQLAFAPMRQESVYSVSLPVRDAGGEVIGAAVLEKSLAAFARDLRGLETPFLLAAPNGVVMLSNRPELLLKPLWSLPPGLLPTVEAEYGKLNLPPLLERPVGDTEWIRLGGTRTFVQREPAGQSGWSIVTLTAARGIFASRVLGIIVTLMVTATALVYLAGRERRIHDNVQMDQRLELELLARDLKSQATTDPVTGLRNRAKFNKRLADEMARAERYATPFSLVLYDIDGFKTINDTQGHQVGDQLLVELSELVARKIRRTDFFARWGGDEFAIIATQSSGDRAARLAKSLVKTVSEHRFKAAPHVTCSFGVAEYSRGETAESLLSRADEALYRAKMNGRNRAERAPPRKPNGSGLVEVA